MNHHKHLICTTWVVPWDIYPLLPILMVCVMREQFVPTKPHSTFRAEKMDLAIRAEAVLNTEA